MGNVTPQELELTAPMRPHTSFSQLDTYRRCSLQYYFKYVEGKRGRPNLNLARGKAGHTAVESNSRKKLSTGLDAPAQQILDTFSDAFEAELQELEPSDLLPGEDVGETKDGTIESLRVYRAKVAPTITPRVVEFPFELDLPATEAWQYPIKIVNGRIDLISTDAIDDAKFPASSRGRKNQNDVDDSWQLSLYDTVFKNTFGIEIPNLGFQVFIPPNTRNPADVQIIRRSPALLEPIQRQQRRDRLEHVLRTTQKAIDTGIFMPADDPRVCSRCDFRTTCKSSLAKDDFAAIALREKGTK